MSFGGDLRRFKKKALENTDRVRRAAIIEILSGVVLNTPVLSGRARGNWQTTVNSPANNQIERLDKGGDATIRAGSRNLGKLTDDVYIANNVPYIRRLNEGSSTQAPANFVEAQVLRVKNLINRQRNLIGR